VSIITARLCKHCGAALPIDASPCPCGIQTTQIHLTALSTSPGTLAPGVVVAGRYLIEAKFGEGGFGVVYKAIDTAEQNRLVALKQITLSALNAQEQIEATSSSVYH
jgi:hypothetical protein